MRCWYQSLKTALQSFTDAQLTVTAVIPTNNPPFGLIRFGGKRSVEWKITLDSITDISATYTDQRQQPTPKIEAIGKVVREVLKTL